MQECTTVYEVGIDYGGLGAAGVLAVFALLAFVARRWIARSGKVWLILNAVVIVALVVGGAVGVGRSLQLRRVLARGHVEVVEGRIRELHTSTGVGPEHFYVAGVYFEYRSYRHTGGFNQTAGEGGPIREGLPVRISYVRTQFGNTIVRIETCGDEGQ